MFGDRTMKKFHNEMENAAIGLTMAQSMQGRMDPAQIEQGNEAGKRAVVAAASAAINKGHLDEVAATLGAADDYDMFRGDDRSAWIVFLADIRTRLDLT